MSYYNMRFPAFFKDNFYVHQKVLFEEFMKSFEKMIQDKDFEFYITHIGPQLEKIIKAFGITIE